MGTEATETEIDINEPGNPDTTFAESESQPDSILNKFETPETNPASEPEYSSEKIAEDLNAKGEADEGKEFIATPKAEEELVYKIDRRDYIVTVKNGIETPIESKDEGKLREIVSELKANGTYFRYDTVEELGDGKVEQGNQQQAEKIEAGTRFGTLYVLNRADMTYRMYTVKEVSKETEEQVPSDTLDADDDDKTVDTSFFGTPKTEESAPEPMAAPQVSLEAPTLATQNEVAEPVNESNTNQFDQYEIDDGDDYFLPPIIEAPQVTEPASFEPVVATEEVAAESYDSNVDLYDLLDDDDVVVAQVTAEAPAITLELKDDEPEEIDRPPFFENYGNYETIVTTNTQKVPEIIELGNIDQKNSESEDFEEASVIVSQEPVFYREEKFVVTGQGIIETKTQNLVEDLDDIYSETENVEDLEPIRLIELSDETAVAQEESNTESVSQQTDFEFEAATLAQEQATLAEAVIEAEPIGSVIESGQEASKQSQIADKFEESGIKIAETTQVAEKEATAIGERMEAKNAQAEIKQNVEPVKISEPIKIVVEPQIKIEQPTAKLVEEKPAITIQKPEVKQAEPNKQILEKSTTKLLEEKPATTIEKPVVKIERQTITQEIKLKAETVKISEPIKIVVEPKINFIQEKPAATIEKPNIKINAQKVEAPQAKVQEKIVDKLTELSPISIIATAPDLAKISPTRNESKVVINDKGQQFRNSSSPLKVSVAKSSVKSETLNQAIRQNGISKIIDDLETNNSHSPVTAQRSGISIATIAN